MWKKGGQSKVCDTMSSAVLDGVLNERKQKCGKVSKEPREILTQLNIHNDYLELTVSSWGRDWSSGDNPSPQWRSNNATGMLKIRNKIENIKSVTLQHN